MTPTVNTYTGRILIFGRAVAVWGRYLVWSPAPDARDNEAEKEKEMAAYRAVLFTWDDSLRPSSLSRGPPSMVYVLPVPVWPAQHSKYEVCCVHAAPLFDYSHFTKPAAFRQSCWPCVTMP